MSQLTQMLGSEYPIIQGPIGTLNSAEMVAAVSNAGGYGMLALGFIQNPDEVKAMVDDVKKFTDKPFGANLMIINPNCEKILKILADAGVKTITTSVGNPSKLYPLIHDYGMKGLHVVLAISHAVSAARCGVDGIVMAGAEAGGLRSQGSESSTMILVPLAADTLDIPVVAAGGIADSRGYRAALALGAEGVQIGTRLIASKECTAAQEWKQMIVNCQDGGTELVPVANMNVRAIMTPSLKEKLLDPSYEKGKLFGLNEIEKAWTGGDFEIAPPGAGQVCALIRDVKSVKEIIDEMVS